MGRGKTTFLIENVPLVTCPSCGESYYTAETLKEIERIRLHWRQLTVEKPFPLATFGGAA
ncbi:MAG: type II toxin-antitoxin system MqsA family antitoxin [Phycisphaerae bacterium]|nr:type II toxin-antitoxin system MqsA family antitoxin [Phycisphaerae bacterium]